MANYILKRFLLIFPTLFVILLINFMIIHIAPGGPVENLMAKLHGIDTSGMDRLSAGEGKEIMQSSQEQPLGYQAARGLDTHYRAFLEKKFGFDKPIATRFLEMASHYLRFDFGESYFKNKSILTLIIERLPISISLGFWSTFLIYFISIPLGIKKALYHGSKFDLHTTVLITIGHAIPAFLFAILLIILFAGGSYFDFFPLRGIVSYNWEDLSLLEKIKDYFWHLTLPIITLTIGGFASLTLLTKNSFLEEIGKLYVLTAKAKGLQTKKILYGHVFRNAMLLIISVIPSALIGILFTGALVIEVIFSLDGLGMLGYEAILTRDYPIIFGVLYMTSFLALVINLVSDITYHLVDPRIHFKGQ